MKAARKIVAVAMAAAVCATSFMVSGCSKQKGPSREISEKDTWYSLKKFKIGEEYVNDPEMQYVNTSMLGLWEDKMVFSVNGMLYETTDPNYDGDYSEFQLKKIDIYTEDGTLVRSIDLKEAVKESGVFEFSQAEIDKYNQGLNKAYGTTGMSWVPYVSWDVMSDGTITDGKLTFTIFGTLPTYDFSSFVDKYYMLTIDLENGKFVSSSTVDGPGGYVNNTYDFEGYSVRELADYYTGDPMFTFVITGPDGSVKTCDLSKLITDFQIGYVRGIMYLEDAKVLLACDDIDFARVDYFELDLKTCEINRYLKDISKIAEDFYTVSYVNGLGNVIADGDRIVKYDVKTGKKTELFSFDNCNINRQLTQYMQLLKMTEDKIYLTTYIEPNARFLTQPLNPSRVYVLTKENTNPNAGKTVLTLSSVDKLTYSVCEAVSEFNETSSQYFIKYDTRYTYESQRTLAGFTGDDEDFEEKELKLKADLSYQLIADLSTGDGPDIVINGSLLSNVNKDDLLLDLKSEIGTDGLFEHIVKASEKEGKIYNYPVAVNITGIVAKKESVPDDQYGFTYDQYNEFVKTACNGKDPLDTTQMEFFSECMNTMQSQFIKDKKVNYDDEEFRTLAKFVSESIINPVEPKGETYIKPIRGTDFKPLYEDWLSFNYCVYRYPDHVTKLKVLGLPSSDGKGPSLTMGASVAIAAQTKNKEGCISFIKTLLSDKVQEEFMNMDGYTPVRKAAFEKAAYEYIDVYNAFYENNSKHFDPNTLAIMSYPLHTIDKSAVENFEEILENCKTISSADSAITMIMKEELPAYFVGQKTIDQVIKIINDRAQTYINERG